MTTTMLDSTYDSTEDTAPSEGLVATGALVRLTKDVEAYGLKAGETHRVVDGQATNDDGMVSVEAKGWVRAHLWPDEFEEVAEVVEPEPTDDPWAEVLNTWDEVTPEPQTFKVGDRVRISDNPTTGYGGYVSPDAAGLTGEVREGLTAVGSHWVEVDGLGYGQYIGAQHLALIEQEPLAEWEKAPLRGEPIEQPEERDGVKVGDRVIVKAATYAERAIGKEAVVTSIHEDWTPYRTDDTHYFEVQSDEFTWNHEDGKVFASKVEKVEEPQAGEGPVETPLPQVGDVVTYEEAMRLPTGSAVVFSLDSMFVWVKMRSGDFRRINMTMERTVSDSSLSRFSDSPALHIIYVPA